jgi:hypothetical protein
MPRQPTYFLPLYLNPHYILNSPGRTKYLMLGPRMASVSTVTVDLFFGVILTVFRWVFICGSTAVSRSMVMIFQVEVFPYRCSTSGKREFEFRCDWMPCSTLNYDYIDVSSFI